MSDIPPPLIPDPAPKDEQAEDHLLVPFVLADAARLQLSYLAKHPGIAAGHREAIGDWLVAYNSRLVRWLHNTYGPGGVHAAAALSRAAADYMNTNQVVAQKKAEQDLFAHLEEEMGKDDE